MYNRALKTIRQYHRLTQAEIARDLSLSRSYVNELERGHKDPSLDVLTKYAERFDIALSSLMLFAERTNDSRVEKARAFAADKVLRMLEWLAEDEGEERGKTKHREVHST
jgi:transcriptional regulator with XRE-family HTH domain